MKSDIKTYDLNTLDINSFEFPDKEFNSFVLCTDTEPNEDFLSNMCNAKLKEIFVCGKCGGSWEYMCDKIAIKQEDKGHDWICTSYSDLDSFISFLSWAHIEYYDDEVFSHNPILLFYDDEKLKDYIIKRVEKRLDEASKPNEYDNEDEDNFDYEKYEIESKRKKRLELNAHTDKTPYYGFFDTRALLLQAGSAQGGVAITDYNSVQSFVEAYKIAKTRPRCKLLYGADIGTSIPAGDDPEYDWNQQYTILCKNNNGKKALYELIGVISRYSDNASETLTSQDIECNNLITKIIKDNRNNILLGTCPNFVDNLMLIALYYPDYLAKEISKYDYIQVLPINNYYYTSEVGEDVIKECIKNIIVEAKKQNKLVVATNSPYYLHRSQCLEFSILYESFEEEKMPEHYDHSLYHTEEMKYAFDWLNDDDLVEEIVVTNTHKIADMCEEFEIIDNEYHPPIIEDSYEKLESIVYENAKKIYGDNLDSIIKNRIETELKNIKDNNYSSIYMLHYLVNEEAKTGGYITGSRGSIGATLVGFLLELTKCNPLPPHYVCPNCHTVIWQEDAEDGFDLRQRTCENCQTIMKQDGHNIPYETFMGFDGNKSPDIDVNVPKEFLEQLDDVLKKVAPNNKAIRQGTPVCIQKRRATEIVDNFLGTDSSCSGDRLRKDLIETISLIHKENRVAPFGYRVIIPNNIDINDFTPIENINGCDATHIDYHDFSDSFYLAHFLEHADPTCLTFFKNNGINMDEINILDPKVLEIFKEGSEIGYDNIPEFGNSENMKMLIDTLKPESFSDFVKVSTLAHGTNVWTINAKQQHEQGVEIKDMLGSRDDVFNALIKHGVDRKDAYEIMETVRKGKGINKKQEEIIRNHNLPDWFVHACKTILYMFPKAHAVGYVINALSVAWVKVYKPEIFKLWVENYQQEGN